MATSTIVYLAGNEKLDNSWNKKIEERNEVCREIAKENGYLINDLFSISKQVPKNLRYVDGTHYLLDGYECFANEVMLNIKKILQEK